jgi:hypothetical protein
MEEESTGSAPGMVSPRIIVYSSGGEKVCKGDSSSEGPAVWADKGSMPPKKQGKIKNKEAKKTSRDSFSFSPPKSKLTKIYLL